MTNLKIILFCTIFFVLLFFTFYLVVIAIDKKDYKSESLFSNNCRNDYKEFVVKAVCDGDTISLTNCRNDQKEKKIRLLGIDAFEHDQKPYGEEGRKFLTMLVLNKKVCIELDKEEKDIYERTLGYVFFNNDFVNEELIKNGLALLYDFPPNIKYIDRLKKAQIYARENMLGVWKAKDYIKETPYQYRKRNR